jgi:hypothetical protein
MCAAVVTNPIDVVKTRLQLQGELSAHHHRRSLLGLTAYMVRTEGVLVLYKGVMASVLREGSYSTIRMGLYEPFKRLVSGQRDVSSTSDLRVWQKLLAGGCAGMTGAAIANPTDLIKVRMQADTASGGKPRYASMRAAFAHVYRQEGWAGLYRGVGPTTQRAALLTATQLTSYDTAKRYLLQHGWLQEGMLAHVCASMLAGLACATTTSPIDLVKSRYMNQPFDPLTGKGLTYASTLDCFVKTLRTEGPLSIYKGFTMNWLRIGPHTITTFVIFERLRQWAGLEPV